MANLKDDLDHYLLLQAEQKKKFNVKVPQIKVPEKFGKIFNRNTEPEANSWLKDTQDSCCPKLVSSKYQNTHILYAFSSLFFFSHPTISHDCSVLWALLPVWAWVPYA